MQLISLLCFNKNFKSGGQSVNRLCVENQAAADEHCKAGEFTSCVSCATDECNGAAEYGPIALLVVVPVAIAKIFLN